MEIFYTKRAMAIGCLFFPFLVSGEVKQGSDTKPLTPQTSVALDFVRQDILRIRQQGSYYYTSGCGAAFRMEPAAYTVSGINSGESWSVTFRYSVDNSFRPLLSGNQLDFAGKAETIQFVHTEKGLRQNFIIHKKEGGSNDLRVQLELSTSLQYSLADGQTLVFSRAGKKMMCYDDLHVWDADHKTLKAHFSLSGNQLSIVVDDRNARYPVTIDPLSHNPEWTTSADGVLSSLPALQINSSLYGFKVKYVGDVNNDGFGDVAVSAPGLADIITGSGSLSSVGAVYIFHGSASGISLVPSNVLQPNTAVTGALFGFSVEGRDLNNDGFSDLVIGAPLDQVTINVGLGTASGMVGKVYVYSGATMGTSNPSFLLSLSLTTAGTLNAFNISNNALFGFSVAAADDMNGDSKPEIMVGSPTYATGSLGLGLGAQTGGAFIFYSNVANTFSSASASLVPPSFSQLGITLPGITGINGLLFGYSVDGAGDYNLDGNKDVIVGAPAGVDLTSFGGILTGQALGGSAYIYYDQAGSTGVSTSIGTRLQAQPSGLLGSAANLFGMEVRGLKDTSGARIGNVAVGAPVGSTLPNALTLTIQTGMVNIFQALASPVTPAVVSEVIETPRSTSLLNVLNTLNLNVMFGESIDNAYDVNCDGLPDLVVGEPLSSGATVLALQAAATGGDAYVYLGIPGGLYASTPAQTVSATYGGDFLSANLIPMFGFCVSGMPGPAIGQTESRVLIGAPGSALDFTGVLNLGNTLGTLFGFVAGNNGPGKAYSMYFNSCGIGLPVSLMEFNGEKINGTAVLNWSVAGEKDINTYRIERSSNGRDWTLLGTEPAAGRTHYNFTDLQPLNGDNYYRLGIGFPNNFYSNTIRLDFSANRNSMLYPNPAAEVIHIMPDRSGRQSISIFNAGGLVVAALELDGKAGAPLTLTRAQLGNAAAGAYWLIIIDEGGSVRRMPFVLE